MYVDHEHKVGVATHEEMKERLRLIAAGKPVPNADIKQWVHEEVYRSRFGKEPV